MRYINIIIGLFVLASCSTRTEKKNNDKLDDQVQKGENKSEVKLDSLDILKIIFQYTKRDYIIKTKFSLNSLNLNFRYNNPLYNFMNQHLDSLKVNVTSDNLFELKSLKRNYENVYVRIWKFKTNQSLSMIFEELSKNDVVGREPHIKEPHFLLKSEQDLFIVYTDYELARHQILQLKDILEDSVGVKGYYSH